MKNDRQTKILEIIAKEDIETQNQLMEALHREGLKSTQATLSRDIKQLRLVKELTPDGSYRYAVPTAGELSGRENRLRKIFKESVTSIAVAQNLVVIKTLPGLADAACSTMDSMEIEDLVGSIAGDDTAFLAMKTAAAAERFIEVIREMM